MDKQRKCLVIDSRVYTDRALNRVTAYVTDKIWFNDTHIRANNQHVFVKTYTNYMINPPTYEFSNNLTLEMGTPSVFPSLLLMLPDGGKAVLVYKDILEVDLHDRIMLIFQTGATLLCYS